MTAPRSATLLLLAACAALGAAATDVSVEANAGASESEPAAGARAGAAAVRGVRAAPRALSVARWAEILSKYARAARPEAGAGVGNTRTIAIDLDIGEGGGEGGRGVSLPLLVLPLPLPGRARAECESPRRPAHRDDDYLDEDEPHHRAPPRRPAAGPPRYPPPDHPRDRQPAGTRRGGADRPPHLDDEADELPPRSSSRPSAPRDRTRDRPRDRPIDRPRDRTRDQPRDRPSDRLRPNAPPARPRTRPVPPPRDDGPDPQYPNIDVRGIGGGATSPRLVELFRAQQPSAPHLPPALLEPAPALLYARSGAPASAPTGTDGEAPGYLPPRADSRTAPPPSPPRFDRSMRLRATLTAHHADYTEPYTVWWDARSGAARVDYHDAGTTTFRMAMPDGRMQSVEVRTDRTGEREVVRCGVARARSSVPEDRAPPALPDTQQFTFAGTTREGEMWTRVVSGRAGELGAARGEALTVRHELMVARAADGSATPLRYLVTTDSSVLGAACDRYEHRYMEARAQEHDPSVFSVDLERTCDEREELEAGDPEHAARLDPLREFTLPARDPRYDAAMQRFEAQFERRYADDTEGAVRKALLVQHSRFISSCNRQDATFQVEVNFLGDRLDVELDVLLGVLFDGDSDDAEEFPYSRSRLRALEDRLPREFDWRPRGAVSPVRYQGSCSSCWAFAVAGSVEGALFVRTRSLVPLSEQCLVDCAHSHGAHGCGGTWPSHAYDYVRERGLPARDDYTPYQEKVLPCRAPPKQPVTHISGHVNVTPNTTDALKVAIRRHAPTVVVVDARPKTFMFYKKGVLRDERCLKGPNQKLNHAVLAVGWGEQRDEPHFILKNTYSARWGDAGYIRLHAPSNTCGHLSIPSYAKLARGDVDRLPPGAAPAGRDAARAGDADEADDEAADEADYEL